MNNELTTTPRTTIEQEGSSKLIAVLKKYEKTFKGVLPKQLTPDRWAWLCINSLRATPELANCTPASFINSVMLAANMGLEIRARSAYLIPFGTECQLLIDYRSKIDLARRSGKMGEVALEPVREMDVFEYERTSRGTHFKHKPYLYIEIKGKKVAIDPQDRGEIVLGYSAAEIVGAERAQIDVMTLAEVEALRKRSKKGRGDLSLAEIRALKIEDIPYKKRSPWITDYDQMFRKTLAHRGANYWPQSMELNISQEVDDAVTSDAKMPIAPELSEFMQELDPGDNHPMVEIPEGHEEQREAQVAVAAEKLQRLKSERRRGPVQNPNRTYASEQAIRDCGEWGTHGDAPIWVGTEELRWNGREYMKVPAREEGK